MKNNKLYLLIFCCAVGISTQAQHFSDPAKYLNFITKLHREVATEELTYVNALVHTHDAHANEEQRKAILTKIKNASFRIDAMHPYKADKSLQDSAVKYMKTTYNLVQKDFPKLKKMGDSAFTTYASYKKYVHAQQTDLDKVISTETKLNTEVKKFASKYNVEVPENTNDLYEKFLATSKVNSYHDQFRLFYLRCHEEEAHLINAMNKKDSAGIKKHAALLLEYAKDGLGIFDTLRAYENESDFRLATKQALMFYQSEAEVKAASILTFIVKDVAYANAKKVYDAKSQKEGAQEALEELNKTTAEYNELVSSYIASTNELNAERPKIEANWEKAAKNFLDKYVP